MLLSELMSNMPVALLPQSCMWTREVRKISELDVLVFVRAHDSSKEVIAEAGLLVDTAFNYAINAATTTPRVCDFRPVPEAMTVDELISWLSCVPQERRRAILFALETGMDVRDVVELTWKNLPQMGKFSEFSCSIVRSSVRHIKLPYVFWETIQNGAVTPLFGLASDAEEVAHGHGFARLRQMYSQIIYIDRVQERVDFVGKALEICGNDLYTPQSC